MNRVIFQVSHEERGQFALTKTFEEQCYEVYHFVDSRCVRVSHL